MKYFMRLARRASAKVEDAPGPWQNHRKKNTSKPAHARIKHLGPIRGLAKHLRPRTSCLLRGLQISAANGTQRNAAASYSRSREDNEISAKHARHILCGTSETVLENLTTFMAGVV